MATGTGQRQQAARSRRFKVSSWLLYLMSTNDLQRRWEARNAPLLVAASLGVLLPRSRSPRCLLGHLVDGGGECRDVLRRDAGHRDASVARQVDVVLVGQTVDLLRSQTGEGEHADLVRDVRPGEKQQQRRREERESRRNKRNKANEYNVERR